MNVIIAGSRNFSYNPVVSTLDHMFGSHILDIIETNKELRNEKEVNIVSGTAKGADRYGELLAKELGYGLISCPARWDDLSNCKPKERADGKLYNPLAGHIRNKEMAEQADILIALWDKKSSGTKNMVETMVELNKLVYLFIYEEDMNGFSIFKIKEKQHEKIFAVGRR